MRACLLKLDSELQIVSVTWVMYAVVQPVLISQLTKLDSLGALIAAAIHDFKHPGVNNAFLAAIADPLAITYNDNAVLENMHVAEFFRLVSRDGYCLFKDLSRADMLHVRRVIIDLVLGTDMAKHFEDTAKFTAKVSALVRDDADGAARAAMRASNVKIVSPKVRLHMMVPLVVATGPELDCGWDRACVRVLRLPRCSKWNAWICCSFCAWPSTLLTCPTLQSRLPYPRSGLSALLTSSMAKATASGSWDCLSQRTWTGAANLDWLGGRLLSCDAHIVVLLFPGTSPTSLACKPTSSSSSLSRCLTSGPSFVQT